MRELDRAIALMEARRSGLGQQAEHLMRQGTPVRFYRMQQGTKREAWTRPPGEIVAMAEALGVKVAKPSIVTPAQARKLGLDPAIVAAFSERPAGAMKLVADDGRAAAKAFGVTS